MSIPEWFWSENSSFDISANRERKPRAIEGLKKVMLVLAQGGGETEVQSILKEYPELLGGGYRTGHGTWGFPEFSFPPEYRADWLVASGSSGGILWDLIELEDPQKIPFKQNGHYSDAARKGIEQIKDWRHYIQSNNGHVNKSRADHGLGLHDLRPKTQGIVVVGRREVYSSEKAKAKYDENRHATLEDERIRVMSYETFLDHCMFEYGKPPLG